ncbi:hypothetical protein C8Q74DRAFT_1215432 [Fomes fomentarius]|nr:hypothetical protein C8Q74DRAFT_1215432 [Fomes fomentarius]
MWWFCFMHAMYSCCSLSVLEGEGMLTEPVPWIHDQLKLIFNAAGTRTRTSILYGINLTHAPIFSLCFHACMRSAAYALWSYSKYSPNNPQIHVWDLAFERLWGFRVILLKEGKYRRQASPADMDSDDDDLWCATSLSVWETGVWVSAASRMVWIRGKPSSSLVDDWVSPKPDVPREERERGVQTGHAAGSIWGTLTDSSGLCGERRCTHNEEVLWCGGVMGVLVISVAIARCTIRAPFGLAYEPPIIELLVPASHLKPATIKETQWSTWVESTVTSTMGLDIQHSQRQVYVTPESYEILANNQKSSTFACWMTQKLKCLVNRAQEGHQGLWGTNKDEARGSEHVSDHEGSGPWVTLMVFAPACCGRLHWALAAHCCETLSPVAIGSCNTVIGLTWLRGIPIGEIRSKSMGCKDIVKGFGIREEGVEEDIVDEGGIGDEDIDITGIEESKEEEGGIDEDTIGQIIPDDMLCRFLTTHTECTRIVVLIWVGLITGLVQKEVQALQYDCTMDAHRDCINAELR